MAEPITNVDPRIYGGDAPTGHAVPEFDPMGSAPVQTQAAPAPERVSQDQIGAGTLSAAVGQNQAAINAREVVSGETSALAAIKSWSPMRVWDYVNMPHFDADPQFDPKPYINGVRFVMSEDEQKFLAQSKSLDEFQYRVQNTEQQRQLYQQMGDHPFISTVVGFADPGYLALDLASAGVASVAQAAGMSARAARITAGLTAAGSTYGLGVAQNQVVPMSESEIILPALMSGAASSLFYRPKAGLVPHDTTYPTEELTRAVNGVTGETVGVERRVVAEQADVAGRTPADVVTETAATAEARAGKTAAEVVEESARNAETATAEFQQLRGSSASRGAKDRGVLPTDPTTDGYSYLGRFVDDKEFGPMIRTLMDEQPDLLNKVKVTESDTLSRSGRPFYRPDEHTVFVPGAGHADLASQTYRSAFAALHETVHALTVHKLRFGLENPGTAHGKIVQQLEELRQLARSEFYVTHDLAQQAKEYSRYFLGNLEEFVAGLYSGKDGGLPTILSRMKATGAPNMLSKMVGVVRKLLGLAPQHESALTQALGLTDELMRHKLTVKYEGQGRPATVDHYAPAPSGTPEQMASTVIKRMEGAAAKTGNAISWSLHKTLSGMSSVGKKVADLLVDDPVSMTKDSVISQKAAIRSDLAQAQYVYEDALKAEMANRGAGLRNRLLNPRQSAQVQKQIEREVYTELQRRWNVGRQGGELHDESVPKAIRDMADAHDRATALGGREMQTAGVLGADGFDIRPGYTTRKWNVANIEAAEGKFQAAGMGEKEAKRAVRELVTRAIVKAQPDLEEDAARIYASAILDRAKRKGYFEDQALRSHAGNSAALEIRDILEAGGLPRDRVNRAMEVITGVTDEAGKSANLKHRVEMDTLSSVPVGDGGRLSVMDLLDTNVARNLDTYLDNSAGNAALARKGLGSVTEIADLRKEFLHGIESEARRKEAAALFDQVMANIKGEPAGEDMSSGLRKLSAVTQMVGLASSGLWQVTEYANAMAKYGLVKTTKEIMRTMPVFRQLMDDPFADGGSRNLSAILSRNSYQDMRIRPFIQKMEDNFEMDMGDHVMLLTQQAKQLVPYINAMRYIHHNQAKVVGNLVADVFEQAANGSAKARAALEKYGLEGRTLDSIASDVKAHGLNTENWSDDTWAKVRGPLNKMMDDAVLKNRTGEIPAFAQFSSVGKFIFTFRSFMLGAHNKVLAGSVGREGFGGLGLLMAYQFPLTMLATVANNGLRGNTQKDNSLQHTALLSLQQMGAMGMFGDLWGIASGDKQQFGASGLMAIDRLYKTGAAVASGNFGTAASGVVNSIPLLSIVPGVKAFAETLKDDPKSNH